MTENISKERSAWFGFIFCQLLGKEKIKSGGKENNRKHGRAVLSQIFTDRPSCGDPVLSAWDNSVTKPKTSALKLYSNRGRWTIRHKYNI